MAILDRLEMLCERLLDPEYEIGEKAVKQAKKVALLVKEWRQTGHKPKGLLHELFILHGLVNEQDMQSLNRLRNIDKD